MATSPYGGYLSQYYQRPTTQNSYTSTYRRRAPGTSTAPKQFSYGGARSYSQYTPQNTNSMYSSYLKKQYSDPTKLAANEKGETAYDLQRQRVQGDTEAVRSRATEDLERRMAATGAGVDSGVAFKQRRMLNKDIGEAAGRQTSDIAMEEMGARERLAERLGTQAYEAEQAGLERSEAQRQFDSSQDLTAQMKGADLAQSAWKFENEEDFRRWAREQDIADADIERAWQTNENEREREASMSELLAGKDYTDVIASRAEERKTKAEYYHTAGQAGSLGDTELAQLQQSDPSAYMAYMAGKEGKSVDEAVAEAELKVKIQDAIITAMADPNRNKRYINDLVSLAGENGIDIKLSRPETEPPTLEELAAQDPNNIQAYYKGAASESSPNNYAYQQALKSAPVINPTIDNPRLNLIKDMPEAGSLVNVNGRLMQVTKTARRDRRNAWDVFVGADTYQVTDANGETSTDEEITGRDADYFELIDLSTGKKQVFTGSSGDITAGKSINGLDDWSNSLTVTEV